MEQRNSRCRHGMVVCSHCIVVTDAAKRMADQINARMVFTPWDELVRSFMAFRLDDGATDGVLYASRSDALRYQLAPCAVFCFRNAQGGVNARDMQIFLNVNREAYENDRIAWTDPASPDIIISTRGHDVMTGRVNPHAN